MLRENLYSPISSTRDVVPTFDPKILKQVLLVAQSPVVVRAMQEAGVMAADKMAEGERGRLAGLSREYHHSTLLVPPIQLLMLAGIIEPGYSVRDTGCSMVGHVSLLPDSLRPLLYYGVDREPGTIAGAGAMCSELRAAGLLGSTDCRLTVGDHTKMGEFDGITVDTDWATLAIQYGAGESMVDALTANSKVAIIGDVVHSPRPITEEELSSGIIPVQSDSLPGDTGVYLQLEGRPNRTPFGDVYDTAILLDRAVYDGEKVLQVPLPGAEHKGKMTVTGPEGRRSAFPWSWEDTKDTTGEDIKNLVALRSIFFRLWEYSKWNSAAVLGVPVYAAGRDIYSAVMFNTAREVAKGSGALPLSLLKRFTGTIAMLSQKGVFPEVGEGGRFKHPGELSSTIGYYLENRDRFAKILSYGNPLLAAVMATRRKEAFEAIKKAAV